MIPSKYQAAIYEAFEHTADSILVRAVAGAGKTTVLMELAKIAARCFPHLRIVMVAFNKPIADELTRRLKALGITNVIAMTLHSAGWAAWRRAGGLEWQPKVDSGKVSGIMQEVMSWEERKHFAETTRRLVGYAKGAGLVPRNMYLDTQLGAVVEPYMSGSLVLDTEEQWEYLMDHYGLDEDECNIDCVRRVLARSIELSREACDFDDMLYMPVIAGVPFDRFDVVLVDEAQDVSGIQMEMISRMVTGVHNKGGVSCEQAGESPVAISHGGRVIAVGDRAQSIYGFRGAGTNSMDLMRERFQMRELPLSVSYRCPVAVVQHAQKWVPQIEWRENAEDGYVGQEGTDWPAQAEIALGAPLDDDEAPCPTCGSDERRSSGLLICECPAPKGGITKWRGIADFLPGDAVLCRLTRPLVAAAFTLIRRRIACRVLGRDIGKGIVDLARRAKASDIRGVLGWLEGYEARETRRLRSRGKHAQAGQLVDRVETLRVFCAELADNAPMGQLIAEIEGMFKDDGNGGEILTLSTIHKFKGMERERVFVLDAGELMPCPWARGGGWELEQEWNLCYVAATRAKRELRYITSADLGVS
jgi:DNA helicase-2/ATP-dependent DNA helicase PcrA